LYAGVSESLQILGTDGDISDSFLLLTIDGTTRQLRLRCGLWFTSVRPLKFPRLSFRIHYAAEEEDAAGVVVADQEQERMVSENTEITKLLVISGCEK
jgi:hypothetical protein